MAPFYRGAEPIQAARRESNGRARQAPQEPGKMTENLTLPPLPAPGERRFGRFNWLGLQTLALREMRRFLAVWTQTIAAPLVTAGLFLAIFSLALGPGRGPVMGVEFIVFLAPGILMMTVIQNAFANTSSSIVISKVQGNIVDTLMPPLSPMELMAGYMAGGAARGMVVAILLMAALWIGLGIVPAHPLWVLLTVLVGSLLLSALGIVAGIYANKFDQIAAITNFVVTPLSFLSGTFYALDSLPGWMQVISHLNPVFYVIDGARWGYLGTSDSDPVLGLAVAAGTTLAVSVLGWSWFRRGYRLKA
jgi:ABC-2 type transport system permease protein